MSVTVMKRNLTKIKGSFATLVTNITANLMKKNIDMGEFLLYITILFPPGDLVAYARQKSLKLLHITSSGTTTHLHLWRKS